MIYFVSFFFSITILINTNGMLAAFDAFESVSLSPTIKVFFTFPPKISIVSVKCFGLGLL